MDSFTPEIFFAIAIAIAVQNIITLSRYPDSTYSLKMGSQQSVPVSRKKRSSFKRATGSSSNSSNDVSRSTLAEFDGDVGDAIDPESVAKWEELLLSDPKVFPSSPFLSICLFETDARVV